MSPIQRGELENIVNAQIAAIVVLSRHLKWIKSSIETRQYGTFSEKGLLYEEWIDPSGYGGNHCRHRAFGRQ